MTEDEARDAAAIIAPDAMPLLTRYADLLCAENANQNLVARSSEASLWSRHLLDSLQLARFSRESDRTWIDVGSGPGLPGLVLAILSRWRMTLVEPRRRRAEFLHRVVAELGLAETIIVADTVSEVRGRFDLISARAVARTSELFALTAHCTHSTTRYVLPKGRSARADVDIARARWHGVFHVEPSLTDPAAGIVIAERVARR